MRASAVLLEGAAPRWTRWPHAIRVLEERPALQNAGEKGAVFNADGQARARTLR
jgi:hypothetical protein